MILVLFMLSSVMYAQSYFHDFEGTTSNALAAHFLDLVAESDSESSLICSIGDSVQKTVTITNGGGMDFEYTAATENLSGDVDFCSFLLLDAKADGNSMYIGFLTDFVTPPLLFTPAEDLWTFTISLSDEALPEHVKDKSCEISLEFKANQEGMVFGEGYYDSEPISFTLLGAVSAGGDDDIEIINDNEATVINIATSSANTGGNTGGTVTTGDVSATTTIRNIINVNITDIESCDCEESATSTTRSTRRELLDE